MAQFSKLGKVDPEFFNDVIYSKLGAVREEILHGPKVGFDNGIVSISEDQVLVVTTDPLTYIPELGPADSAWISAHLLASDLATSGLMPQYAVLSLNLPPHLSDDDFRTYWDALHHEFEAMGTAVIAGHTGRYPGCDFTIVGSGTLMAIGPRAGYLSPDQAQPGDVIIITKGAMVGTSGLLARVFPQALEKAVDAEFVTRVQKLFGEYATIPDVKAAISAGIGEGGVTSIHDVTEGGVLGALYELALAANCGIKVEVEKIPLRTDVKRVAEILDLDPFRSLSEGTLLITAKPNRADAVMKALAEAGIVNAQIGVLNPHDQGLRIIENGTERALEPPRSDRYWDAYQRFMSEGKK